MAVVFVFFGSSSYFAKTRAGLPLPSSMFKTVLPLSGMLSKLATFSMPTMLFFPYEGMTRVSFWLTVVQGSCVHANSVDLTLATEPGDCIFVPRRKVKSWRVGMIPTTKDAHLTRYFSNHPEFIITSTFPGFSPYLFSQANRSSTVTLWR